MPGKPSRKPASARKATPKSRRGNAGRILTTHVGSLIRPPKLQEFLKAQRDREPYEQAAFDACLHDAVADVVHKQAEIGLDVINDGEYGKTISWSRYVLERMSGFEQRDRPAHAGMPAAVAGRDRREFAEFYADYDRHQGFTGMTGWALTGPIRYTGHAALARDIANFKAAAKGAKTGERRPRPHRRILQERRGIRLRRRRCAARGIQDDHRCRPDPPGGRRLPGADLRGYGAAEDVEGLPQMGGAPHRGAQPCA
jgi:hypothetical protein